MGKAIGQARRALLRGAALGLLGFAAIGPALAQGGSGPRLGTYKVVLVQLTTGSITNYLVLKEGGQYDVRELSGALYRSGTYRYDEANRRVIWLSGLNYEMGRGGTFTVEEGGRVHRILMGPKVYAISGD